MSLAITVYRREASPNKPSDATNFSEPTLTLMIDSFILDLAVKSMHIKNK